MLTLSSSSSLSTLASSSVAMLSFDLLAQASATAITEAMLAQHKPVYTGAPASYITYIHTQIHKHGSWLLLNARGTFVLMLMPLRPFGPPANKPGMGIQQPPPPASSSRAHLRKRNRHSRHFTRSQRNAVTTAFAQSCAIIFYSKTRTRLLRLRRLQPVNDNTHTTKVATRQNYI